MYGAAAPVPSTASYVLTGPFATYAESLADATSHLPAPHTSGTPAWLATAGLVQHAVTTARGFPASSTAAGAAAAAAAARALASVSASDSAFAALTSTTADAGAPQFWLHLMVC